MASVPKAPVGAARQDLYRRMDKHDLIPNEPATRCKPALWKYRDARPYLMEAGRLITAREAIRRVLILPGEIAPSHRHSQSALRFIVEGSGAYTAVDGERTLMHPGDFIITPSWTWHDHGNPGEAPVVWLDGLDIRIVQAFGAQFHEPFPQEVQPVARSEGASAARFGANLLPLGAAAPFGKTSPIFNYPYARSREALAKLAQDQAPDACHGWKMQFINPLTGGHAMPTIGAFLQLLPKGFGGQAHRSTDGTVYSVVEGTGAARIGDERFDFEPRDTFVVPSWAPLSLEAAAETVLFSFSDRPCQEALGLWREKRG